MFSFIETFDKARSLPEVNKRWLLIDEWMKKGNC